MTEPVDSQHWILGLRFRVAVAQRRGARSLGSFYYDLAAPAVVFSAFTEFAALAALGRVALRCIAQVRKCRPIFVWTWMEVGELR